MQTGHVQYDDEGEWTPDHTYFEAEYIITWSVSGLLSEDAMPATALRILESDPPR